MNELSLLLSVGAFVYLVYAMLRPREVLRPPMGYRIHSPSVV